MKLNSKHKLTIFIIAISGFLAFLGTISGAIRLASLFGLDFPSNPILLEYHPYLQLYGFVYLFIIGVSHTLIPRFKGKRPSSYLAYLVLGSFLIGLFALGVSSLLGYSILLTGSLLYAIQMVRLIGKPSGHLALSEWYFLVSAFLLVSVMIMNVTGEASSNSGFYVAPLQLSLLGFPTVMIFGIELRTLHLRGAEFRRLEGSIALILLTSANAISGLSGSFEIQNLTSISSILFIGGGVMFIKCIQIFKNPFAPVMHRMNLRDRKRYSYFTGSLRISFIWLIAGLVMSLFAEISVIFLNFTPFGLRDAYIHSLGVGFIGSTIMGYAPILLPAMLLGRAPYEGLSSWPLYLVNSANLLRIVGILLLDGVFSFWPTALSGPLIILGMVYFMLMIHRLIGQRAPDNRLVQIGK